MKPGETQRRKATKLETGRLRLRRRRAQHVKKPKNGEAEEGSRRARLKVKPRGGGAEKAGSESD